MKEYFKCPARGISRRDFLKAAAIGAAAYATPASAQEEADWLLGVWGGEHMPWFGVPSYQDFAKFEFQRNNDSVLWKVERTVQSQGTGYLIASGRVLKAVDDSVELKGQYDPGTTNSWYVGKPVSYSLTPDISKNIMSGAFFGADNVQMVVKLEKKRVIIV